MFDIMVDIETLSTHPNNAVVLSVGAIKFKLYKDRPMFFDSKLWALDIHEQIAEGREVTEGTIKWWREQSDDARRHWAWPEKRFTTIDFLNAFRAFYMSLPMSGEDDEPLIWSNGICFDIGNLDSLYGGKSPWRYNSVRDHRTIIRACAQQRERPADIVAGAAHDPVADCRNQVWQLWEHWTDPLDDSPMEKSL